MATEFPNRSTFTNPLLPAGADPWSMSKDGWFYYTHTTHTNITLWRTRDLTDLRNAESRIVWRPEGRKRWSKNLWAPELHWIGDRWYVYFAADNGQNRNHRMYVLEGRGLDPLRAHWSFLGELVLPENRWSIDGTVLRRGREMFFIWSGWQGVENGEQKLYIARMDNARTIGSERVCISCPTQPWERHGIIRKPAKDDKREVLVNEGPSLLQRHGRIFVVYSASGSWTKHYALGLLWADGNSDLMDPASWRKKTDPVFLAHGSGAERTYAAGHNSFFQSPDGSEDWILYHANSRRSLGWGNRSPRAQKFTWTADGFPDFGYPVSAGERLPRPSSATPEMLPEAA